MKNMIRNVLSVLVCVSSDVIVVNLMFFFWFVLGMVVIMSVVVVVLVSLMMRKSVCVFYVCVIYVDNGMFIRLVMFRLSSMIVIVLFCLLGLMRLEFNVLSIGLMKFVLRFISICDSSSIG